MEAPQLSLDTLATLRRTRPRLHGVGDDDWSVDPRLLDWLTTAPEARGRTLETGIGVSSILFATLSADHVVVAPSTAERDRVLAWCAGNGVDASKLRFFSTPSQDALPKLVKDGPLDLVLIDGGHGFPVPLLDWFYTADRLKRGGVVLVDDTHLRACRLLMTYLKSESGVWETVGFVGRTAIFRKSVEGPVAGGEWTSQSWSARQYAIPESSLGRRVALLRARVRLRSRIRERLRRNN